MQDMPLSESERAELEALRAEKARRDEEERARRERAELEALRAELRERPASPSAAPAPEPVRPAAVGAVRDEGHAEKTFGQRMVTSNSVDGDGVPSMPPAQIIVIAVCLLGLVAFGAYCFLFS